MVAKSKYTSLVKDTAIFSIGKIGSRFVLFLLLPLYTNCLTKAEYGIADLVFTASQLLVPVFSVVIFDAVVRFALAKNEKRNNVFLSGLFISIIGTIILLFASPLINLYKPISQWKWFLIFHIVLTIFLNVAMNYLKAINKNLLFSIIGIIQALTLALLNIYFLVFRKMGIEGYLLAYIISYAVSLFIAFVGGKLFAEIRKAKFDKKLTTRMIAYSSPLILNNISWWVIQSSDKLMVEGILSEDSLGVYTTASKIPALINVIISIFQQSWGLSAIKEFESSNEKNFYANTFRVYCALIFAACLCINSVIKPFMEIYVGADFVEAWQYVPLLLASAGFSAISAFFGTMYGAIKKPVNNMVTTIIAAITNFVLNLIFINRCGIWGAVLGTIVSYIVVAFIRAIDIFRLCKFGINWIRLIINSVIIIAHSVFTSFMYSKWYISILLIILYLIFNFNDIKQLLNKFVSMVKRRKNASN